MIRSSSELKTKNCWNAVALGDKAFNGGLNLDETAKYTQLHPSYCEFGEEALDDVELLVFGQGEVEGPARVAIESGTDLGLLVDGKVVWVGVDDFTGRKRILACGEIVDKVLMAVALSRHKLVDPRRDRPPG
ncbi:hypothetical protein ACLBXJ_28895 [Methylobacterium mesophilicum]|nr:hypothetical protein [Methylobacterium mesophilicum]TXN36415.1 hypothetical protein FV233_29485 [Methylobacterium sp. WL7]